MEGNLFPDVLIPKRHRTVLPRLVNGNWGSRYPNQPPIPRWLMTKMTDKHGVKPRLIQQQKTLTATDLTEAQGRLLLPPSSRGFFTEEELTVLGAQRKQGVPVVFLGIDGEEYDLELRKWNGFVLTKGWKQVIRARLFNVGDTFQFWCFRLAEKGEKLCFALVREADVVEENVNDDDDAILVDQIAEVMGSPIPEDVTNLAEVEDVVSCFINDPYPGNPPSPRARRVCVLLGSLLSYQVNTGEFCGVEAIRRLHKNGFLNLEALDKAEESTIAELIYSVPSDTSKETATKMKEIATKMKEIAKSCVVKFNGDIPTSVEELVSLLPVIHPNIADTILRFAWNDGKHSDSGHGQGSLPDPTHAAGGSLPDPGHAGSSLADSSYAGGSLPETGHAGGSLIPASPPLKNPTDSSHAGGSFPNPGHAGGSFPDPGHAGGSVADSGHA